MLILAIETSTLTGSVALVSDGLLLGETTLSVSAQHSERLMPAVERLLASAGVDSSEIDLFAVADGPGSFTGLRIGIAAAQGFALAHNKPLVGVSTLEGLAMNALYFPGTIVPVINAFRHEIYRGRYRTKDDGMVPQDEDRVMNLPDFLSEIANCPSGDDMLLLGNGLQVYRKEIEEQIDRRKVHFAPLILDVPKASSIAAIALKKSNNFSVVHPVLPKYLRQAG